MMCFSQIGGQSNGTSKDNSKLIRYFCLLNITMKIYFHLFFRGIDDDRR